MTTVSEQPQTSLLPEQVIADTDLEAVLEQWISTRESRARAAKKYKSVAEAAKGRVLALGIKGRARCGRFLIRVDEKPGKAVSFETKTSTQIRFSVIPPE